MNANPYMLKELVQKQLIKTEIPYYFEWLGRRIYCHHKGSQWIVYDDTERLYKGYDFDRALDWFLLGE